MNRRVVVVGAGGNIGSHVVPLLARMPEIGRLVLIDPERYEPRNGMNQAVTRRDQGRLKAKVQAARVRAINPGVAVQAVPAAVERVPLAALRADAIVACLDSRAARQHVNRAAWLLGVPWLDAGVRADGSLARVTLFRPGPDAPCLECGWSDRDYAALEQRHACGGAVTPPTGAPAALGALAASLQALALAQLLRGDPAALGPGGEVVVDTAHHRHFLTARRRSPDCRLAEHAPWAIEPLPRDAAAEPLAALLDQVRQRLRLNGSGPAPALRVEGHRFVREVTCPRCHTRRRPLRVQAAVRGRDLACPRCRRRMAVTGFGLADRLDSAGLTRRELARPLTSLGLRSGDVLSAGAGAGWIHFEVTA